MMVLKHSSCTQTIHSAGPQGMLQNQLALLPLCLLSHSFLSVTSSSLTTHPGYNQAVSREALWIAFAHRKPSVMFPFFIP